MTVLTVVQQVVLAGIVLYAAWMIWPVFCDTVRSLFDPEWDRFTDVDALARKDRPTMNRCPICNELDKGIYRRYMGKLVCVDCIRVIEEATGRGDAA